MRVDGADASIESKPPQGEVLVPLNSGLHRVEIRFRRTPDRTAGMAISGASFLVFLAVLRASRRGSRQA
jgi:hypothetical protein